MTVVRNTTGVEIEINDFGVTIPIIGTIIITADSNMIDGSDEFKDLIYSGKLVYVDSNGIMLSKSDSIDLHKVSLSPIISGLYKNEITLSSPNTSDGVPYIYSTSKPIDHYVCFQGAGDTDLKMGEGNRLIFDMKSLDLEKEKDFVFNEDVYVKDGYIIAMNAPFGASMDIEIVHPIAGHQMFFGKRIPIFGSGWFPMDTEDRAYLPKGLIIRVRVYNSNNAIDSEQDQPSDFRIAGRFELYRKKPTGV